MRYSKIEVTGSPIQPWWHTTTDLYTDLSQLKKFGEPLSKTEDGLLFFITGNFYRFILIPENHPIFNIRIIMNVKFSRHPPLNNDTFYKFQLLTESINDKYIKVLFTQEVAVAYINSRNA